MAARNLGTKADCFKMRSVIFLLILVAASLNVNALSVASDYLINNTMELMEGTSKIYSIRLQNPANEEVGVKLDYDASFMEVINYKETYILPPKTPGHRIEFNVTANKKPGLYTVSYTVNEVEPSGGGGLPIRLKINRNFNLRIAEDPNKLSINYYLIGYIAVLSILAFALFKKITARKSYKKKK